MKKIKLLKLFPFIVSGLLGIIMSFIFGYLISNLNIELNIIEICILFIVTYYFAVAVHELTHFAVFKINKIDMRCLVIGPFIFLNTNNKWVFKFKFTKLFFAGGIAIPDIDVIQDDKDLSRFREGFAKALISAPIVSIILNLLFAILTFISLDNVSNDVFNKYMLIILILLSLITLLITISSMIKNEIAIGDYQAYFSTKKDIDFVVINLYQYIMFSTKYTTFESRKYLIAFLDEYFQVSYENKVVNLYLISCIDNMLHDYLTDKIDYLPKGAIQYINFSIENYKLIYDNLKQKEVPSIYFHNLVLYLSLNKNTKYYASEFYSNIHRVINISSPVIKYYNLRTTHLLGLENNSDYICDKYNIKTSSLYELLSLFEWYYDNEYYLCNKLHNTSY